jgi:hypothetical protein
VLLLRRPELQAVLAAAAAVAAVAAAVAALAAAVAALAAAVAAPVAVCACQSPSQTSAGPCHQSSTIDD